MNQKTAVIIGAGPAGLTAAYELVNRTNIKPIIYEMNEDIGGICKTVNYKGNLIVALILLPIMALIFYIKDHWDKILEFFK